MREFDFGLRGRDGQRDWTRLGQPDRLMHTAGGNPLLVNHLGMARPLYGGPAVGPVYGQHLFPNNGFGGPPSGPMPLF